jgi:hypothetical protein
MYWLKDKDRGKVFFSGMCEKCTVLRYRNGKAIADQDKPSMRTLMLQVKKLKLGGVP